MTSIKEFKINDYPSLKLENGKTVIYVADKAFLICKYLLLNIPKEETWEYNTIESIDEVIKYYSKAHDRDKSIPYP